MDWQAGWTLKHSITGQDARFSASVIRKHAVRMPAVPEVQVQHLDVALRRLNVLVLVSGYIHLAKSDRDLHSRVRHPGSHHQRGVPK